ncbi:hypothetical protein ACJMK2_037707 [Sinanodonta woodiana]|uniref:Uncharacterized protein n=1 Tax=Sinanodonta woodiana TaxID=1069815 RepID=A0ABD3WQI4_SINWO
MVGKAFTTRLNQERLAAIKKFIPLRDKVREKLQQRQQTQIDFTLESEQLFFPITSATKDVKTAAERAIWGEILDLEKDTTPPTEKKPLYLVYLKRERLILKRHNKEYNNFQVI